MTRLFFALLMVLFTEEVDAQIAPGPHHFALGQHDFLLDGKPFQLISGEMHPARIPREYWQQRIRMAKAMGCNTIAVYVFWNYQEPEAGHFDFSSGNRDIAAFIRLCQAEGLWVLLRPGPYVCAEWDWGGLPPWLLKIPDIKVRCRDPRYMSAVSSYVARLSREVATLQCDHGGPILMVQIENEYGSYANDKLYLQDLRRLWKQQGIAVPFYTADGPTDFMLEAGSLDGCAIGLDSGGSDSDFDAAHRHNPNVPAFSSETYPGWLTHWKEEWQHPDTADILQQVDYLLSHHRSFNLYVIHGGTNFGFTAGANAFSPTQFQPDVTSYDYDAPITEQGRAAPKYYALRDHIARYAARALPAPPPPIPVMEIPAFTLEPFTSLWDHLPRAKFTPQPMPMEHFGQQAGMILYRTRLIGHKSGSLTITEPHDYALVFLDGQFIDSVYRDGGKWTVKLPVTTSEDPVLEILVEGMGHINFAQYLIDRKGITDRVTLNGMTLMNWETFNFPLDEGEIRNWAGKAVQVVAGSRGAGASAGGSLGIGVSVGSSLGAGASAGSPDAGASSAGSLGTGPSSTGGSLGAATSSADTRLTRGVLFKGSFELDSTADTYLDMSGFRKGYVWVNGHNLGRYWYVGPQQRLYCPASWLKKGRNEVIVLDLHQQKAARIKGVTALY